MAPTADAGGPYAVDEGQPITLAGTGDDANLAQDPLTFIWDLDNDGVFDDAAGTAPAFTWAQSGVHPVAFKVSDGLFETISETR